MLKFYRCKHCGQIIIKVEETKVPVVCCGEPMEELVPGSVEASVEKHLPVLNIEPGKVKVDVGSVAHPMSEEHYIKWVAIETEKGFQVKYLKPNDNPHTGFKYCECDKLIAVYAYCNLHGLWKTSV